MEEKELEMTQEELQSWISETVQKMYVTPPDVLEQCNLLKSLLEKREKQTERLLELSNSAAAHEAVVKELYAFLGWEYTDIDSDDGVVEISEGVSASSTSEIDVCGTPSRSCSPTPNNNLEDSPSHVCLIRQAKVVLIKLKESEIWGLARKSSENHNSGSEHSSPVASEPDNCADDSDFVASDSDNANDSDFVVEPSPIKRRRIRARWPMKVSTRKTSGPPPDAKMYEKKICNKSPGTICESNSVGNNNVGKSNSTENNTKSKTNPIESNKTKATIGPDAGKARVQPVPVQPSHSAAAGVCIISTCCLSTEGSFRVPKKTPEVKIEVSMKVLAKKTTMYWQHGKVKKIMKMADNKLKYLVRFQDKAKRLVSAHHLAFSTASQLDYLYIGARVVVGRHDDVFRSAILAELPTRKNQQRFLVFIDDKTALYVGLPHLHLVCAPLDNPADDITNASHREFVKEYLNAWPCPPLAQCKPGLNLNVEQDGVQQNCVVELLDCSLMQVVFVESQRKEWIYRGSWRLEHMVKIKMLQS